MKHLRRVVSSLWLAGWAAGAAFTGSAQAQPADTIAQRVQACTVCHGKEGRATNAGYFPRIAGKPAGYLYNQLVNFRDGRRSYASMNYLVEHMSDTYLREIAGYFAALDLPYPAAQTTGAAVVQLDRAAELVLRGDIVRSIPACVSCHGDRMTGAQPAIPGLVGLPRDYLIGQLGAWKSGQRRAAAPDCMASIVERMSTEDIAAVATWLSSQAPPADAKPAAEARRPLPINCGSGLK